MSLHPCAAWRRQVVVSAQGLRLRAMPDAGTHAAKQEEDGLAQAIRKLDGGVAQDNFTTRFD